VIVELTQEEFAVQQDSMLVNLISLLLWFQDSSKGIYLVENAARFIKPDIEWINIACADRNKTLLLKRF